MNYREQPVRFGSHGGLIGILTEPSTSDPAGVEGKPAIVVSNVGFNHRTGPNRLWVEMARRMAAKGYFTLRFDLDGLGDSAIRPDSRSELERYCADMSEAVDSVLKKSGQTHVALIGLCSGVDPVHAFAAKDARVSEAIFLDGYNYSTMRHVMNRTLLKLFEPRRYQRLFRRFRLRADAKLEEAFKDPIFVREYPPPHKLREDLDRMLAQGTRLYFGFTGGFAYVYSYRDQFYRMLPRGKELRGRIELEMFPDADHLFSSSSLKEDLYNSIERFLSGRRT